jgi:hypothetical protein
VEVFRRVDRLFPSLDSMGTAIDERFPLNETPNTQPR